MNLLLLYLFVVSVASHTLYRTSGPVYPVQVLGSDWIRYRFCLPFYEEAVKPEDVIAMEFQVKFAGCAHGATLRTDFDVDGPAKDPWAFEIANMPPGNILKINMMPYLTGEQPGWTLDDFDDNVMSGTLISSIPLDKVGLALYSNASLGLITTPPKGTCSDPCPVETPYDQCGVCGGDGSSCAGCDGIANAVVDDCGICNGGNACMETVPEEDSEPEVFDGEFPTEIPLPERNLSYWPFGGFAMIGGFLLFIGLAIALLVKRCRRARPAPALPRYVYMVPSTPQFAYMPMKEWTQGK